MDFPFATSHVFGCCVFSASEEAFEGVNAAHIPIDLLALASRVDMFVYMPPRGQRSLGHHHVSIQLPCIDI